MELKDKKGHKNKYYKIGDKIISFNRVKEAQEAYKYNLGIQRRADGPLIKGNTINKTTYNQDKYLEGYNKYIKECFKKKEVPSICNLAVELNTTKKTLYDWRNKGFPVVSDSFEKIKTIQEGYFINRGDKARNPAFQIFMLKANHGYIETDRRLQTSEVKHIIEVVNYHDKHKGKPIETTAEDIK